MTDHPDNLPDLSKVVPFQSPEPTHPKPEVPEATVVKRWNVGRAAHTYEVVVTGPQGNVVLAAFGLEVIAGIFAKHWNLGWYTTKGTVVACEKVRLTRGPDNLPAVDMGMQGGFYRIFEGEWPASQQTILPVFMLGKKRLPS